MPDPGLPRRPRGPAPPLRGGEAQGGDHRRRPHDAGGRARRERDHRGRRRDRAGALHGWGGARTDRPRAVGRPGGRPSSSPPEPSSRAASSPCSPRLRPSRSKATCRPASAARRCSARATRSGSTRRPRASTAATSGSRTTPRSPTRRPSATSSFLRALYSFGYGPLPADRAEARRHAVRCDRGPRVPGPAGVRRRPRAEHLHAGGRRDGPRGRPGRRRSGHRPDHRARHARGQSRPHVPGRPDRLHGEQRVAERDLGAVRAALPHVGHGRRSRRLAGRDAEVAGPVGAEPRGRQRGNHRPDPRDEGGRPGLRRAGAWAVRHRDPAQRDALDRAACRPARPQCSVLGLHLVGAPVDQAGHQAARPEPLPRRAPDPSDRPDQRDHPRLQRESRRGSCRSGATSSP